MPETRTMERAQKDQREGRSPPPKRGNLCAKSFITSARENTGRARHVKPSPLVYRKPGAQELNCVRQ
jgi:hypothetical protein